MEIGSIGFGYWIIDYIEGFAVADGDEVLAGVAAGVAEPAADTVSINVNESRIFSNTGSEIFPAGF